MSGRHGVSVGWAGEHDQAQRKEMTVSNSAFPMLARGRRTEMQEAHTHVIQLTSIYPSCESLSCHHLRRSCSCSCACGADDGGATDLSRAADRGTVAWKQSWARQ